MVVFDLIILIPVSLTPLSLSLSFIVFFLKEKKRKEKIFMILCFLLSYLNL